MLPRPRLCISCEYGGKHCLGGIVVGMSRPCECDCTKHTIPPDDIRFVFMSVLTAEAHNDFELLKTVIDGLSEDEAKAGLLLAAKYAIWMARTAGIDPVQMVQSAALYWSGGDDDPVD